MRTVRSVLNTRGWVSPGARTWLCVLLAVLFLYNPFLAAPSACAGLHVQHTSSNRATVGASELQQFTASAKERRVSAEPAEAVTEKLLRADTSVREYLPVVECETHVPQPLWPASLWFRPPPVA